MASVTVILISTIPIKYVIIFISTYNKLPFITPNFTEILRFRMLFVVINQIWLILFYQFRFLYQCFEFCTNINAFKYKHVQVDIAIPIKCFKQFHYRTLFTNFVYNVSPKFVG